MLYRAVLVFIMALQIVSCDPWEDKFQSVGCKGKYDKYKMAHLERICDECYELYKEQDIHLDCSNMKLVWTEDRWHLLNSSHCFGSGTFFKCMESVALSELRKQQVLHSWDILRRVN